MVARASGSEASGALAACSGAMQCGNYAKRATPTHLRTQGAFRIAAASRSSCRGMEGELVD